MFNQDVQDVNQRNQTKIQMYKFTVKAEKFLHKIGWGRVCVCTSERTTVYV